MSNLVLLFLSVLPVVLILIYVYRKDENQEPLTMVMRALGFGILSILPAVIMEMVLGRFQPSEYSMPIASGLYEGYIVAGLSEELWKLLMLYWAIWKSPHFDEYFDGIVYAVFVSMGFAGIENISYVFMPDTMASAFGTAAMRALVSVPGHFLFAVTMGYYFSLAKFDPMHRASHFRKALLVPMMLHGTFDAILMVSNNLQQDESLTYIIGSAEVVVFIIFDIYLWRRGLRRIREMQELSRQQNFNREDPFANFRWTF